MELTLIQDYAIQGRVAVVIGAGVFESGLRRHQVRGNRRPMVYVYSRDEQSAADIEDDFSLLIADVASRILKREVELVVVLPKVL